MASVEFGQPPWVVLLLLSSLWLLFQIIQAIRIKLRPGLRKLPGPVLASFSDLDRIWSCAQGRQMEYHLKLHEQHGPIVRVGTNHVSLADTSLIPQIYGLASRFRKSEFYSMFDVKSPTALLPTVFSVRDLDQHKVLRREIAHAFSLGSLRELEPMNDECSEIFMRKMEGFVGATIDLGRWLHWYAFDVITSLTYSNRMGFMENETDVNYIIAAIEGRLMYNSIIGQKPSLHAYLFRNRWVAWLATFIPTLAILNSAQYIIDWTKRQIGRYHKQDLKTVELRDMLERMKRGKKDGRELSEEELLIPSISNVFAGSDTTAASLRSVFYQLCRHPRVYEKLVHEIDSANRNGKLSTYVTYDEAQKLPYLQAVIREGLRMHPAVGLLLERVVPADGMKAGNVWLPPGTVVGINPWVAARDKDTYGDDADIFRPERWLEADEEQLKRMNRSDLAFGGGARICLGKNISLMEMSKLVPQVLRKYEFELDDPTKEWKLHDYWFVRQTGFTVKVSRRKV